LGPLPQAGSLIALGVSIPDPYDGT
jgi:hypothetical protein